MRDAASVRREMESKGKANFAFKIHYNHKTLGPFSVTVTKYPRTTTQDKGLFQLVVLEASDRGLLASLLWVRGETAHHGDRNRCLLHDSREGEIERGEGGREGER